MSSASFMSGAAPRNVNASQQSSQVSTTTLLNTLHNIYTASQPYELDASTSLVVNTWLTASQPDHEGHVGGVVDAALGARAWEHARRRAEDGCIMLGYVALQNQTIASISNRILVLSTNPRPQFSSRSSQLSLSQSHPRYLQH